MKPDVIDIWNILDEVYDPEIPVLSVVDLGIVRDVRINSTVLEEGCEAFEAEVIITPTYPGCPVLDRIERDIKSNLLVNGFDKIKIITALNPAWTTDWMSEAGKQKLRTYGIAPPHPTQTVCNLEHFQQEEAIQCPQCNSFNTRLVSRFGPTACKATYQCNECLKPFHYFKCH